MAGEGAGLAVRAGRYDCGLIAAAEMLEVPAPDPPEVPLEPEVRAILDRLAVAGVDVFGPIEGTNGLPYDEDAG